jgi:hypothetical protein
MITLGQPRSVVVQAALKTFEQRMIILEALAAFTVT